MNTDILPPHNETTEWSLLACALEKPDILPSLSAGTFYCEAPRSILQRAQQLQAEAVPELQISLLMELARKDLTLFAQAQKVLNELPSPEHWPAYKAEVEELDFQRAGMALAVECGNLARDGALDVISFAERVKLLPKPTTERFNMREATLVAFDRLRETYDNPDLVSGILSGFRSLDRLINGWKPGELALVGARPSVGKTSLALNFTGEAALRQDVQVVFYSLEMTAEQLVQNLLCAEAHLDRDLLRQQQLTSDHFKQLGDAANRIRDSKIIVRDDARDVEGIASDLSQLSQTMQKKSLVIVDYLQIVQSRASSAEKRYAQVGAVSRALKLLAMQFRVPVIALAQISRELDKVDREPVLADLRESGSLEQDADVVAFLHPTESRVAYKPTPTKCIVAKNRNGPLGSVLLAFHQSRGRFYEVEHDPQGTAR